MPSSINAVFFENGRFVDYVGNPIPLNILGVTGPTGPAGSTGAGSTGATSLSLYQSRKYVKEFWPNGASILTITRQEILDATETVLQPSNIVVPPFNGFELAYGPYFGPSVGTSGPNASGFSTADILVTLWALTVGDTDWEMLPVEGTILNGPPPTATNRVFVSSSTGDITIDYKYPVGNQTRIRAVIII